MSIEQFSLRDEGRYRVLRALHTHGPCRRADIVQLTSLSRSTVASIVAEMASRGIVMEGPEPAPGPHVLGRPAAAISIAPRAAYVAGVDIGHEHVRVAICDLRGVAVAESLTRREVDLTPHETLDIVAQRVTRALSEQAISRTAVIGLGLAISAPIRTESGLIEAAGIMPGWVGISPARELQARTGLHVRVTHGADAGALAERTYGAARGVDSLIYVRLTAGIGAGVIVGGRPLPELSGLSSELGHVQAAEDGLLCRCGNRGCLETVASLAAIARLLSQSWHHPVTPPQVLELLQAGDPGAARAVEDAGIYLGKVLAAAANLLNPALIIIGGDLSQAGEPLLEPIRIAIRRGALPATAASVSVTLGELGEHAEVLGAATVILADAPRLLAQLPVS